MRGLLRGLSMKKIKAIMMICLIGIVILCMTACGTSSEVGDYTIYKATSMGIELDRSELKDMDVEIKLTLNKDGTGNLIYRNENMELTWEKGMLILGGEAKQPYEYRDGMLTITYTEKDIWVFKKN